jgi:carboxymethylenebutenolidase
MGGGFSANGALRRRHLMGYALAGAAAACGIDGLRTILPGRAWAAPAKAPKVLPRPGDPPDKRTTNGITVKPDDPAISAGAIEFPGLVSTLQGYFTAPAGGQTYPPYPGLLLVHDVDGLTEHARDVARRLAKVGYVTLALDLLSRSGGTAKAGTPAQISDTLSRIPLPQFVEDGNTAVRFLGSHPLVSKTRVGLIAFGVGGLFSWFLLSQNSDLKAAVLYYGMVPRLALLPGVTAAVLAIYGDTDGHDADDLKELDAVMKKSGRPWSYKIEAKAGRGFFDDTRAAYVPAVAKDAWKMTLDWYAANLTG